jgi:cytochrome c5
MLKRSQLFLLLPLALLAACGKEEPAAPPPAQMTTPATAPTEAPPAAAPKAESTKVAQTGDAGKKVYDGLCVACHATGAAGAPKLGDKAAWAPRIAQGMDTLYKTSLNGKGAMPPKGGNTSLSDGEVKAAVDYMVAQSK